MVGQEEAVDDGLLEPAEVGFVRGPGAQDGRQVVLVEAVQVGGAAGGGGCAGGEGEGGGVGGVGGVAGGEGGLGAEGSGRGGGGGGGGRGRGVPGWVVKGRGRVGGEEAGFLLGAAEGRHGRDDGRDADQRPFLQQHVAQVQRDGAGLGGGQGGGGGTSIVAGDVEEERAEEVRVAEGCQGAGWKDVCGAFR